MEQKMEHRTFVNYYLSNKLDLALKFVEKLNDYEIIKSREILQELINSSDGYEKSFYSCILTRIRLLTIRKFNSVKKIIK
jgi:hypothetical protein